MNLRTHSLPWLVVLVCLCAGGALYYHYEYSMPLEWQQLQDEYQNTPNELKVAMADVIRHKAATVAPQDISKSTLAFIQTLPSKKVGN